MVRSSASASTINDLLARPTFRAVRPSPKENGRCTCTGHCPSWARTRTLLIQSQACCQLHQGAVFPTRPHGAEGDRTPDLCSAIAALSQLSYSPKRGEKYRTAPCPVNRKISSIL